MKKKYVMPSIETLDVAVEGVMTAVSSISNIEGEVQTPIKTNGDDDFEAGGKKNNFNAWSTWDDDDE